MNSLDKLHILIAILMSSGDIPLSVAKDEAKAIMKVGFNKD
jgi:hypothetical protein